MKLYYTLNFVASLTTLSSSTSSLASDGPSEDDLALLAELATVAPETDGRCNLSDVAIWRGNDDFTNIHRSCARSRFGNGQRTAACILIRFPGLNHSCATCFGGVTECMASHCWLKCLTDDSSEECLACFDLHCQAGFQNCIGRTLLMDPANVPLRPGEIWQDGIATRTTTSARPTVPPRTRPKPTTTPNQ